MNPVIHQLNSIFKKDKLDKEYIDAHFVGAYILIKWVGFIKCDDVTKAKILKHLNTINVDVFDSNYEKYMYLYYMVPKMPYANIDYIKADTTKKEGGKILDDHCMFLAQALEISKREAKYIIEQGYFDTKQISMINR